MNSPTTPKAPVQMQRVHLESECQKGDGVKSGGSHLLEKKMRTQN